MGESQFDEEVDILLKNEAQRIFDILWDMTIKGKKSNKTFVDLVDEMLNDEYKCYYITILNKVTKLIPLGWNINSENGCVFITNEELRYQYDLKSIEELERYSKINDELINNVVNSIIKSHKNHELNNQSLFYFFNLYYSNYKDLYFDYEHINSLLKSVIKTLNEHYIILKISPLRLKEF